MKVRYIGDIPYFKGVYNVVTTIHDGEPLGNGEVNLSGANIYRCEPEENPGGTSWLFREDEVEKLTTQ